MLPDVEADAHNGFIHVDKELGIGLLGHLPAIKRAPIVAVVCTFSSGPALLDSGQGIAKLGFNLEFIRQQVGFDGLLYSRTNVFEERAERLTNVCLIARLVGLHPLLVVVLLQLAQKAERVRVEPCELVCSPVGVGSRWLPVLLRHQCLNVGKLFRIELNNSFAAKHRGSRRREVVNSDGMRLPCDADSEPEEATPVILLGRARAEQFRIIRPGHFSDAADGLVAQERDDFVARLDAHEPLHLIIFSIAAEIDRCNAFAQAHRPDIKFLHRSVCACDRPVIG